MATETKSIAIINKQIADELKDPAIARALMATTFPEFTPELMKQAIFEGLVRGFTFKDFLQRDIYAVKYRDHKANKDTYSLITSIDKARKIGAKSGVVGVNKPIYGMDGRQIISCEITVKKRIGNYVGDFTAEVYFDEYNTDKNQWSKRPRTMIAKVAEMHALRKACPEELSKMYTEEEFDKEKEGDYDRSEVADDAVPTIHIGDDHGEPKPNMLVDKPKDEFWDEAKE